MSGPGLIPSSKRLDERLEDREFRRAYDRLKPRYELAQRLINLRHERGLTQEELANKLGTRQSRISKIEAAENDLNLKTLIEIVEALDAEVRIEIRPKEVQTQSVYTSLIVDLAGLQEPVQFSPWVSAPIGKAKTWRRPALSSQKAERVRMAA